MDEDDDMQIDAFAVEEDNTCDCPVRTRAPDPPTEMPFSTNEVGKLKDWILERYASSTFNVCKHQPLPTMTGEPLRIFLDPDAKPHAVHTPSPIPVHFRDEVKKQLDMDVELGVLEKVPPNTPTKWCARMVIATKHDGSPRRTVDLQALNAASVRQTNNTQSLSSCQRNTIQYQEDMF